MKLHLIRRVLRLRAEHPEAFSGSYEPLDLGPDRVGFVRGGRDPRRRPAATARPRRRRERPAAGIRASAIDRRLNSSDASAAPNDWFCMVWPLRRQDFVTSAAALTDDRGVRLDLPSGTVTFLFTDVEGSTQLLDEVGVDAYAGLLDEHRRIVREVCGLHGGTEVDTQGDAFFLAFARAPDALAAADLITERLADGPVRLRIGVHTGTPLVTDEGYVGADVHRAARIAAAGHGGQVLVSASTAMLVEGPLRDLGEHRFKDLRAPERVFQLGDGSSPT